MSVTARQPLAPPSSFYTRLVSGLIFPLHESLKRHRTVALRRRLEQTQWWSPEQIEKLQFERLRSMLADVMRHVPYYRDVFARAGIDPAGVRDRNDLARLPLLDKSLIRTHTAALRSEHAHGLSRFNTGGSSGEPLIFYLGQRVDHDVAAKWRATRWWGVDIGDPEIVMWGSPIELGSQDRLKQVRDRLLRTRLLPAFEMSSGKVDAFIRQIRATRPRMLFGYPSALAHVANRAQAQGVRMDDLGIAVAFVTAEKLLVEQKAAIERVFACRVANGYGGRDAGFIAHECPHGGMHISAEDIIVETIDADGQPVPAGEPGEIVVTHLATPDFPFIRYRTGDVGVLDDRPCTCGRGLPLLRAIEGRSTDFIVAQDGTVMHGLALIYVVRDVPGVRRFRIEQERLDFTRVLLETDVDFNAAHMDKIRAGMVQRLGEGVEVAVERVQRLAPERSGKYRYVVSRVSPRDGRSIRREGVA